VGETFVEDPEQRERSEEGGFGEYLIGDAVGPGRLAGW